MFVTRCKGWDFSNLIHSTLLIFPGCFSVSCYGDRPLSSWCRWPRSIIYLDQRKRQGCGASNKARGCNRCNASWCACCFVHHGWYSLFIYTVGITGEFMLQAYTMQPLIRTRLLLLAVFAATTTRSSSEILGDDGGQVRRIYLVDKQFSMIP